MEPDSIVAFFITCHGLRFLWKVDRRVLVFRKLWCYLLPMTISFDPLLDPLNNLESEQESSICFGV
jgi:hypothetical protein